MFLSVLLIFCLIVIIIGLATAKLNAKVPCDHHWVETDEGHIKCTRCYRMIRRVQDMSETDLGATLLASRDDSSKPGRPEGIKISAQALRKAQAVDRDE
jgi:hypothetical protein